MCVCVCVCVHVQQWLYTEYVRVYLCYFSCSVKVTSLYSYMDLFLPSVCCEWKHLVRRFSKSIIVDCSSEMAIVDLTNNYIFLHSKASWVICLIVLY